MAMSKPLVLADSQGKYFDGYLAVHDVDVLFWSGAKIQDLWDLFAGDIKGRKVRLTFLYGR